jgi:hypothetical protein
LGRKQLGTFYFYYLPPGLPTEVYGRNWTTKVTFDDSVAQLFIDRLNQVTKRFFWSAPTTTHNMALTLPSLVVAAALANPVIPDWSFVPEHGDQCELLLTFASVVEYFAPLMLPC